MKKEYDPLYVLKICIANDDPSVCDRCPYASGPVNGDPCALALYEDLVPLLSDPFPFDEDDPDFLQHLYDQLKKEGVC